jgi:ornithine carbamoyltransferase
MVRHFLDIADFDRETLRAILTDAARLKAEWNSGRRMAQRALLRDRSVGMIFERPSTRTRVSFDVAITQLGGHAVILSSGELQLGRGETIGDTARVLSRMVDCIMLRTGAHANLTALAAHASVPVINGLTHTSHPCQVMADIMTFEQHLGPIEGRTIAWVGDGNNMVRSLLQAAARLGFAMRIASPAAYSIDRPSVAAARERGADIVLTDNPVEAVLGADCVITDTWISMGDEDEKERLAAFASFQVNAALMEIAAVHAIFMHCLPAHRGMEVSDEVLDGSRSVIWDEAENRVHAQKAILAWCLGANG